jgi:hypothetical protein
MAQSPTVTASGRVIEYGEVATFGTFSKRRVVIEIEPSGQYKGRYLAVDFSGKRLPDSETFGAGDEITVTVFADSTQGKNGNWFNNFSAKSVTVDRRAQRQQESEPEQDDAGPVDDAAVGQDTDEQGSMPF